MFKFLKFLFEDKPNPKVEKDPLKKKLHKERIKRRKALRKNKNERVKYIENKTGKRLYRGKPKKFNKPQDATKSWYYQTYIKNIK